MRWQVYDLGALTATELRMAVRRSIAQSLGAQYPPCRELPTEFRELLERLDVAESGPNDIGWLQARRRLSQLGLQTVLLKTERPAIDSRFTRRSDPGCLRNLDPHQLPTRCGQKTRGPSVQTRRRLSHLHCAAAKDRPSVDRSKWFGFSLRGRRSLFPAGLPPRA